MIEALKWYLSQYNVLLLLLIIALSYLIGNISFSFLIVKKVKNIDIRNVGSGNAGTTNVLRSLGKKYGIMVFVGDFLKGMLASGIGFLYGGYEFGFLCALAVVLGHIYPVFMSFRGGKGVATGIGSVMLLEPVLSLISLAVALLLAAKTGYMSLGSLAGVLLFPISMLIAGKSKLAFVISLLIISLIVWKHRSNIKKLLNGTENKMGRLRK